MTLPVQYTLFPRPTARATSVTRTHPLESVNHAPRPKRELPPPSSCSTVPPARQPRDHTDMSISNPIQMDEYFQQIAATCRTADDDVPATFSKPCNSHATGLRSRERSRYAFGSAGESPATNRARTTRSGTPANEQQHVVRAAPRGGLRRPGDSHSTPASAHMTRKARRLEGELLLAKTPRRRQHGGLAPAMFGTLAPVTLAALAQDGSMMITETGIRDEEQSVRRKPVARAEQTALELRPRPSSPTLVDTFKDFENPPRVPPPTPVANSPRASQSGGASAGAARARRRIEPRSVWDSDEEGEEEGGEATGEDEKASLVERVKSLTLTRGRKGDGSGGCQGSQGRKGRRVEGRWKRAVLCGC